MQNCLYVAWKQRVDDHDGSDKNEGNNKVITKISTAERCITQFHDQHLFICYTSII